MQRTRFPLLLVSLLFCAQAFAQQQSPNVWVIPPSPTNETPITIGVSAWCAFDGATATVNGNVITVKAPSSMCDPPFLELAHVTLPQLLAPGQYRIEAEGIGTRTFIVRDVGRKPFEVHPYAVPANVPPAGALPLTLQADTLGTPLCPAGNCTVTVGGVAAPVRAFSNDTVRVEAPRLPPGVYDVTLMRDGTTTTVPRAVVYFNRMDPPDPTVFERILFPVLFNTRGQHGSDWRTEAVISNPKPWFVEFYNDVTSIVCVTFPCGERIGPMMTTRFEGGRHPGGIALLAPWPEAERLAFALRVRDVSREAESFGTDIPVVRESQMFVDTDLTFLDVPFDARYRTTLRVYAFSPFPSNAGPFVAVRTDPPGPVGPGIGPMGVMLTRNCSGNGCYAVPLYGEMNLQLGAAARSDVYLDTEHLPGSAVWAFITVTNNATQQVTIITPNGKGGEPCKSNCREDH